MYCYKSLFNTKRKDKIVILLGAGATVPWDGLQTSDMRNIFIADRHFKISRKITVGKYLFDILDNFYNNEDSNFEEFIAVIEEILNYLINDTNIPRTSYMSAILDLKDPINRLFTKTKEIEQKRRYAYNLLRYYINLLIDEIVKYNDQVLDNKNSDINASLLTFTKYFLNRGYSVKFYTTNYDNLIPQVLSKHIKIYEGLLSSNSSIRKFNFDLNRFRTSRVSHFNIHGSIFIKKLWDNKENSYQIFYDRDKLYQEMPDYSTMTGGNPKETLPFSPIITGFNKTQRMVSNPFNLGINALINDLNDCRALVTVGYSFSDPHINSILSSFTSCDKAKYIHITKMNREFDANGNKENHGLDFFDTEMIKKQEDETWFKDKTGRKFIYKKGFEEFLSSKSNWSDLL
jgi:hypothetical protein